MMRVYLKGSRPDHTGKPTAIVVESNIAWALPYWQKRRENNPDIYWTFN